MIGIYSITNKQNNKKYIGESLKIEKRWKEHISDLNNNKHHSYKLQKDWNKYGVDSFEFKVEKEIISSDKPYDIKMDIIIEEYLYIKEYDTLENGYNIENTLFEIFNDRKFIVAKYDKHNLIRRLYSKKEYFNKYILENIEKYRRGLKDNESYNIDDICKHISCSSKNRIRKFLIKYNTYLNLKRLRNKNSIIDVDKDTMTYILNLICENIEDNAYIFNSNMLLNLALRTIG